MEEEICEFFFEYGGVDLVSLIMDYEMGCFWGFGFVEMLMGG